MIPPTNHIIVRVDLSQKDEETIGGVMLMTGKKYNDNFRERNPVIAYVEQGVDGIPAGSHVVCNYSFFDLESPLQMSDNQFSVPVTEEIYAIVREDGTLNPIGGNVLVERLTKQASIDIPDELKKPYINRGVLLTSTDKCNSGQYIFWLPYSDYEIVYNWKGQERRALKIHKSEIVGYLKN